MKFIKKKFVIMGILFFLCEIPVFTESVMAEYEYIETTKNKVDVIKYKLKTISSGFCLNLFTGNQLQRMQFDDTWNTQSWKIINRSGKCLSFVEKINGQLYCNGEQIDSVSEEIPWYQSLFCLSSSITKEKLNFNFYIVSANFDKELMNARGMQLIRFKAVYKKSEMVKINGTDEMAMKYLITFDDMRSLFWKSYAWFRLSDALLIAYESARGKPGTPVTRGIIRQIQLD